MSGTDRQDKDGHRSFKIEGSATGGATLSSTFFKAADGSASAGLSQPFSRADVSELLDEYSTRAALEAFSRTKELIAERLIFVDQAQEKVSKMLEESTLLLEDSTSKLDTIRVGLERSAKLMDESMAAQETLSREVATFRANAISALSMFVSFFAFITVTINVFSKASSAVSAAVLVLMFWCLLIGFNVLISLQFKTLGGGKVLWGALFFVILISFFSVFVMHYFPAGSGLFGGRQYLTSG